MYTICYTNTTTGTRTFEITANFTNFVKSLPPYIRVDGIFNEKSNIKDVYSTYEQSFVLNCAAYGYDPFDLHAKYTDRRSDTIELLGLNPRNRKYIFIVKNHTTGKILKVTKSYMDSCTKLSSKP